MTQSTPVYGWKPDLTDHRDKILRFGEIDLSTLPQSVDLRDNCSPVEDQSTLGSCTANATAGALEYLELKDKVSSFENFSRLFIYYNTRELDNAVYCDSGGTLRNAIKSVVDNGACDEKLWPYQIDSYQNKPITEAYADAAKHKITEYSRLLTLSDMLQCLASGFPFVFGFSVYSNMESSDMASSGILQLPGNTDTFLGGHAVLGVGFDQLKKTVLVRNSWGKNWGMGGYFTIPFDYISDPNLASDFWTVRRES